MPGQKLCSMSGSLIGLVSPQKLCLFLHILQEESARPFAPSQMLDLKALLSITCMYRKSIVATLMANQLPAVA